MFYKKIAVAVAGKNEDTILINRARELAEQNDSYLTIIHIDDIRERMGCGIYIPSHPDDICGVRAHNKEYMRKLVSDICNNKLKIRIIPGEMPSSLIEAVKEERCDLLICGHHQSFIHKLLPSCQRLINSLPVNILIVPLS